MKKLIYASICCIYTLCALMTSSQNSHAQSTAPADDDIYRYFKTEHLWDAKVKVADMIMVGESKRGVRRVIPITGGTFEGPNIKGEVLPGGEDWQLVRPDGDTELYARYLLKTNDGYVIQIINQVLQHFEQDSQPYVKSVIDLEAPIDSPYEYLNHSIFLGTLEVPQLKEGETPYVIIGVYRVLP